MFARMINPRKANPPVQNVFLKRSSQFHLSRSELEKQKFTKNSKNDLKHSSLYSKS